MHTIVTATAIAIALSGCAAMGLSTGQYDHSSPAYQQCQYQAAMATPTSNSPIADAVRQIDLINMCMRSKGL